jgi:hypothetical protein
MDVFITDETAARQFDKAQTTFNRILEKHSSLLHEAFYLFGGKVTRIRIVGKTLAANILLPFLHLRSEEIKNEQPHLTIDLWDENETGICRDPTSTLPPGGWYAYAERSPTDRFFSQRLPHTFACLDRKNNHLIGSVAWHNQVFVYERAKPLSRPLLEWHNDQHLQIIHGSLVSKNGQGILFVGKSGSGKSTSALTCACQGLSFLAEDYVALERRPDKTFWGHSVYNSVFLEASHLEKFPTLKPFAFHSGQLNEKKVGVILAEVFPDRLERVAPISVLVVVCVGSTAKARLSPVSKAETLLALGPSSLFQIPSRGKSAFTTLTALAETVPSFSLELGTELESLIPCIDSLFRALGQR